MFWAYALCTSNQVNVRDHTGTAGERGGRKRMSVKLIINMMSFSDHREHKITQKQWQQRGGGGGGVNCEDRGLTKVKDGERTWGDERRRRMEENDSADRSRNKSLLHRGEMLWQKVMQRDERRAMDGVFWAEGKWLKCQDQRLMKRKRNSTAGMRERGRQDGWK